MKLRMAASGALSALAVMSGGLVGAGDLGLGVIGVTVSMMALGVLHSFLERRASEGVSVFTTSQTTTDDLEFVEEPLPLYVATKFGFSPVGTSWIARVNGVRAMLLEAKESV